MWEDFVDCYRPAGPFATSSRRPQQNTETLLYQATSAITHSCSSRGLSVCVTPSVFRHCLHLKNVSFEEECPADFSSLLSLCCRAVLQLKLQQRRTREELVSQGIMPPLKSPAAFHEQRRSLERARTEDYLKRKIRSRPERSELVRMHILEETSAEPSLQAKQLKLKRARLADDLNEKIAQRPGPMELVEKNILPVESSLKEAIIVGQVNYPKVTDSSSFDEDSSDALSPEQPASQESQSSVPSPLEARVSEPLPSATSLSPAQVPPPLPVGTDCGEALFLAEPPPLPPRPPSLTNGTAVPSAKPAPTLIKQSQPKSASEKSQRSKKAKELKPKVKKLKYHQYIPPDQKPDKGAPAMDSSYAKILQQQQLFLQLQILNQQQQQQHYNYQAILPAPPKPAGEPLGASVPPPARALSSTASSSSSGTPGPGGLARQNSTPLPGKPGSLPANLDDMKVAELKQELKLRSLPVSGTKTELIERLRAYQDQAAAAKAAAPAPVLPAAGEVVVAFPAARLGSGPALVAAGLAPAEVVVATVSSNGVVKFGSTGSTPPVSPTPSERSLLSAGDESSTPGDAFGELVTSPRAQLALQASPAQVPVKEEPEGRDKDQMLQEKDKQIEELTRMLRQKQQLVELLRLQLEQEKRAQQPAAARAPPPAAAAPPPAARAPPPAAAAPPTVKQEGGFPSCPLSRPPPGPAHPFSPSLAAPTAGHGDAQAVVVKQEAGLPEPAQAPGPPLLLGPQGGGLLPGVTPPAILTDASGTHLILTVTNKTADSPSLPGGSPCQPLSQPGSPAPGPSAPMDLERPPQPPFGAPTSLLKKEPPGYEEAVTQHPKHQENGSCSQQMDDLFDILIQSGEISADFKEPPSLPGTKSPLTVQASPCQQLPQAALPPPGSPALPGRLEDFLESSTGLPLLSAGHEGAEPLPLIDDLHSQMLSSPAILDHPPSPMDTSDLHFAAEPGSGLGLDLADGHLDSMDWLELSSGGPVLSLAPLGPAAPSLFSTDFLDGHDLQLHWDSCL
ncbi:myocardin-related transcription factor A [Perognathus longimembris pacificus]|uniref:myocardin-related transcription factor A n=1 Tax=Perognathus longimembris pacificus TaxID=214514 RepID=UPI0020189C7E|nr:myocardin-related transcription factor A [Perognathus longimembris pacificus]